jgi:hypothetical protein
MLAIAVPATSEAASLSRTQTCKAPVSRPTASKTARPTPARSAVPDVTSFEGKVLTVRRGAFPDAFLTLDLTRVGSPVALQGRGDRDRLAVQSRLSRRNGTNVTLNDTKTIRLAGAYYLLSGDRIRGEMRYGEKGWTLESLERLNALTPPKVASLRVELSTDRSAYSLGEDVQLHFTVTNQGTAAAVFNFRNGQRYDFAVRQNGQEIWRWSTRKAFASMPTTTTLNPGETMSFREAWNGVNNRNQPVPAGTYTMAGWLTAVGQEALTESTAEIEIADVDTGPSIEDLVASPRSYINKEITLEGLYRARLAERGEPLVQGGPPTSRSDWILQDTTASIYVAGSGTLILSDADINQRVRVKGLVRMNPEGRLYIRAFEVERVTNRGR